MKIAGFVINFFKEIEFIYFIFLNLISRRAHQFVHSPDGRCLAARDFVINQSAVAYQIPFGSISSSRSFDQRQKE